MKRFTYIIVTLKMCYPSLTFQGIIQFPHQARIKEVGEINASFYINSGYHIQKVVKGCWDFRSQKALIPFLWIFLCVCAFHKLSQLLIRITSTQFNVVIILRSTFLYFFGDIPPRTWKKNILAHGAYKFLERKPYSFPWKNFLDITSHN